MDPPPGCALSCATSATASPLIRREFQSTLSSVDEKTTLGDWLPDLSVLNYSARHRRVLVGRRPIASHEFVHAATVQEGVDLSLNVVEMPVELLIGHDPAGVSGRRIDIAIE
jgi:hypothetical protein